MDPMHEKGVKAFPAKTNGKGNQLLAPRLEKGVKIYDLTAEELQWEIEPGALGRSSEGHKSGDLGLPLPHPSACGVGAWDVRHGDRLDRAEAGSRMTVAARGCYSR